MSVSVEAVREMAIAMYESLKKLSAREREQMPTPQFAAQYNTLLELAKEAAPGVDKRLFPAPVLISEGTPSKTVAARYIEIETYVSMIIDRVPAPPSRKILSR